MEIKGTHFLITGANRGIGRAVAFMAAREGAHLYLANRTVADRARTERELLDAGAASVKSYEVDLTKRESLEKLWKSLASVKVDIVFNNAGQFTAGMIEDQDADVIDSLLMVNVNALIHLTRLAVPGMLARGRGKIINHSSIAAVMAFPGASTYAASKAAVRAFTDGLRHELHGTGVTLLTLVTASVETRMLREVPEKCADFLEMPNLKGMEPEHYALRIRDAILEDENELIPTGIGLLVFWLASYFPSVYRRLERRRFRRPPIQRI